jgi:hypothetical protein
MASSMFFEGFICIYGDHPILFSTKMGSLQGGNKNN